MNSQPPKHDHFRCPVSVAASRFLPGAELAQALTAFWRGEISPNGWLPPRAPKAEDFWREFGDLGGGARYFLCPNAIAENVDLLTRDQLAYLLLDLAAGNSYDLDGWNHFVTKARKLGHP